MQTQVDAKLANWMESFEELQAARRQLKVAIAAGDESAVAELEDDVVRLRRLSGVALDELHAEYAR
ncbi:MAG: hypothetical protein V4787_18675 [Pseudomonadota bacterium]